MSFSLKKKKKSRMANEEFLTLLIYLHNGLGYQIFIWNSMGTCVHNDVF